MRGVSLVLVLSAIAALLWLSSAVRHSAMSPALADEPVNPIVTERAGQAGITVDPDGSVHLPAMTVPFSDFASAAARAAFLENQKFIRALSVERPEPISITEERRRQDEHLRPALDQAQRLYATKTAATLIAGVRTDTVMPADGMATRNRNRLLINLPGGAFRVAGQVEGLLESQPLASLGKIKVVTIHYRQGPEHKFPAATEDVVAVYREVLRSYKPQNIGIYGCSAGGVLTAEVMAWMQKEHLPAPGAIGIFCASAAGYNGGDSGFLALPLSGWTIPPQFSAPPHPSVNNATYFSNADFSSPLVEPIRSNAVLARFPPTLIITSTRDIALSSAIYTHTQLVKLGVDAELHVWEGMEHAFFVGYPELPESREAWDVITKFFDRHLGTE